MLNIGIIGAGFFGEKHAEAIAALDDARVVAASRNDIAALADFTRRFGGRGYTDYREILADPNVDAVLIATPHHLHTDIAIHAAQAGKHILLEKPMAPTLAECDQILRAVDAAGVRFMVGHINQFAPTYKMAKELITSGEMGEVVHGVSVMNKLWMESNRRDWHLDRTRGGGMWLTAGMHCLDRLTWLVGSRAQSVSAQFDARFHAQQADDVGMIFLRYANGAAGTVISTGYRTGAPTHSTELTCTKGMLKISYDAGIQIGRDERWRLIPESTALAMNQNWMATALVDEWRTFIAAIETGGETAVTGAYARHIMATAFAAEESSRLHREVDVPH
jgi:phthalate 4,5-cis-dihydrodiol dehydrogenase